MPNTTYLNIPLIDRAQPLLSNQFNDALEAIDKHALHKDHAKSSTHWSMWQSGTAYKKQDVFRTEGMPSWGYWEVTTAGTSGSIKPVGYGEGDTFQDGSCILILRRLTQVGGISKSDAQKIVNDSVPKESLWAVFKENTAYAVGDIFRTPTTPSWGYWKVTTAGVSGTTVPAGSAEHVSVNTGTITCELVRIGSGNGSGTALPANPQKTSKLWKTATGYNQGDLVSFQDTLYMCLLNHTSSIFLNDLNGGYWKKIDNNQTVVGSDGGYSQITVLDAKVGQTVSIQVNDNPNICFPPVDILKKRAGASNQTISVDSYGKKEDYLFEHGDGVEIDGGIRLRHSYSIPVSSPVPLGNGYVSKSDVIDFDKWKSVKAVVMNG